MQQLFIPVPADRIEMFRIYARVCKALKDAGFHIWEMRISEGRDGAAALLPRVLFTNRPGDPANAAGPGTAAARRFAYREVAKVLGLSGLYPVEVAKEVV